MPFQQDLQETLEAVTANATELLKYLKSHPSPEISSTGLPADALDGCPATIKDSRRKLTDASAKLLQLGTRPQEYLEHLQNGVRWTS